MTSAIFDFADIHSRMLGNHKPTSSKPSHETCPHCFGNGWYLWHLPPSPYYVVCHTCKNPENKPKPEA